MRTSILLRTTALAGLLMTGAAACDLGSNPPALIIRGNQVPEKTEQGCAIPTGGGGQQQFWLAGRLDLAVGSRYRAFLSVQNNFPTLQNLTGFEPTDARLEAGTILLTHAELTYRISQAAVLEAFAAHDAAGTLEGLGIPLDASLPTTVNITGTIPPQSFNAVQIDLIPANHGILLRGLPGLADGGQIQVVVDVELVGTRVDGSEIRSGIWSFPITLCNGCGVSFAFPEAIATRPFTHPSLDQPLTAEQIGTPCTPGVDENVSNAFCGAFWGPESGGGGNTCKLNRCFGRGGDLPGTLICTSDVAAIPAPVP